MTTQGFVQSRLIENGIFEITFHHPNSNSLPGFILQNLANTITEVGGLDDCKVIILKSEGEKAFCAGASFDELASISNKEDGFEFFSGFAKVINSCKNINKIIIGRIHQKAVGGGVGIAASCDYTFATKLASIKLSELAVGIGPFVVGPAVERKVGLSAYTQLTLNATNWQSAEWAAQKGLYHEVFETIDLMDEAILKFANTLSDSNPNALSMLKKVFWEGTDHWETLLQDRAKMSGTLVLSDFTKNAIQSFKQK